MKGYLADQNKGKNEEVFHRAMQWSDPGREVGIARKSALELLTRDRLYCVWTGKRLTRCLPWSAWPCGDLWNLLPADRSVNQRLKSDRLPSWRRLARARELVFDWWDTGYLRNPNVLIGEQFLTEASVSLPGISETPSKETIFDAIEVQRLRLHHDQQVPEW